MSAAALYGAQAILQTATGIASAYHDQQMARLQSYMMEKQMQELDMRANMAIAEVGKKADKVVAGQTAAFISGGVELSGSAMSVISDTLNNAAQAQYIQRRETDYALTNMRVEKGQVDMAASNETMFLKMASSTIGAAASFGKNMASHGKGGGGSSDAKGIDLVPDRAGGTTQYSLDYLKM